jgi:type I restriction enzyme S subunit
MGEVNCANIVFARPLSGISDYLNYYFQSPFCQKTLEDLTTGSAQGVINTKVVALVPVAIPPTDEQHEVVRRVEALFKVADQIEARYNKAKAYVDKLAQSILAKAFRGELVPQDPNDEPASALLEHIRKQRAESEPSSKKSRPLSKKKQANLFDEA